MIYALRFSDFDNRLTLEWITAASRTYNSQFVVIMLFYDCYSKYAILLI